MTDARARLREHWTTRARRHPSAFLLAAQVMSLLAFPLLEGSEGRVIFSGFSVLVLLLAVWVVNRTPAVNWIGCWPHRPACARCCRWRTRATCC